MPLQIVSDTGQLVQELGRKHSVWRQGQTAGHGINAIFKNYQQTAQDYTIL